MDDYLDLNITGNRGRLTLDRCRLAYDLLNRGFTFSLSMEGKLYPFLKYFDTADGKMILTRDSYNLVRILVGDTTWKEIFKERRYSFLIEKLIKYGILIYDSDKKVYFFAEK